MPAGPIRPNHKAIAQYYEALREYSGQHVTHEGAVETAFSRLLADTARPHGWLLIPKLSMRVGGKSIAPDGTLRDEFNLKHGYWEAKDTHDDLDEEIGKKIKKGYPLTNTIFEDTREAVLYQNGVAVNRFDLTEPQKLADLLNDFYAFTEPDIEGFEQAVAEFKERVPELAQGLADKIKSAHKDNSRFEKAFEKFFELCQQTLNPNIRRDAVDEMLVQHLLTERLFRTIFNDQDFTRRNVIAAEIERVIDALVSQTFSRTQFLKSLDRFYRAIEAAATTLGDDFSEKQHFLNTVYERFFQGYSVKVADTHGIVYTPQEIVDFMCASVSEVLQTEFGLTLGSKGVNILDPCTGTGNFIVNILRRIPRRDLPRMYREQLFANEVMLLPYYIAALNIEHAYAELTGEYAPFEGLCFVDTLDMAEEKPHLFSGFDEKNTERVERQRKAPITVIIGNPPYNMGQLNENDDNKNRNYESIDKAIAKSYAKDSTATLRRQLYDPYVRFIRWATDRLQGRAFDGMRKHLQRDFDRLHVLDLKGNIRKDSMRDGIPLGEKHTVFGLAAMVGIAISVLIRNKSCKKRQIVYDEVAFRATREEKFTFLRNAKNLSGVNWRPIKPDAGHTWLVPGHARVFASFLAIGDKSAKSDKVKNAEVGFKNFGRGVATNADAYVYDFRADSLRARSKTIVEDFNSQLDRWKRHGHPRDLLGLLKVDEKVHKWIRNTKRTLLRGKYAEFEDAFIRDALYRPFCKRFHFFHRTFNEDTYQFPRFVPTLAAAAENPLIAITDVGSEKPFLVLMSRSVVDMHVVGAGSSCQCFPFYVYDEDGSNRRENITDWALEQFRGRYGKTSEPPGLSRRSGREDRGDKPRGSQRKGDGREIGKWDIFYYVYGILHHPGYRTKFADNLKRELPRIPFAADFWAFADAGKELARLHLDYEKLEPWPLEFVVAGEHPRAHARGSPPLSYRVEKMKLSKDKTELIVNPSLTLAGIPPEVFEYRLGNRSALEWVIDQYQVSEDKRSGIRSDPNRADDPEYIVRLVGQVVRVSLEMVKIVQALPAQYAE